LSPPASLSTRRTCCPFSKHCPTTSQFRILGFHADNGSEYINHTVANLLEKLRVEFTKSPPRHSNNNGLAETKNGALVRKHLGYSPIPQRYASEVNAFCQEFLNPYVNFHRPCFFAESFTDDKGKTRKRYLPCQCHISQKSANLADRPHESRLSL
jgi:transposase InsO family protein